jgi:hypothetical protein
MTEVQLTLEGKQLTADEALKSKVLQKWRRRRMGVYEKNYGKTWEESEI